MQYLTRELYLKDKSNDFLQQKHLFTLDLSKRTLIIDNLQKDDTLEIIKEYLSKDEFTFISDLGTHIKSNSKSVLDLRLITTFNPYEYLNLMKLLKQQETLIVLTNEFLAQEIIEHFDNCIEIPHIQTYIEEQFISTSDKLNTVLQQIKKSQEEIDRDILIYCDNLYQMDQIYQALHYHNFHHQVNDYEIHLILPSQNYYKEFTSQILEMCYPQIVGKRKVYIGINFIDVRNYLRQINNHQISLIIQMGHQKTIKTLNEINCIIYAQLNLSKADVLLRNRVSYFPKVIYLYEYKEFLELQNIIIKIDDEFQFNSEYLKTMNNDYQCETLKHTTQLHDNFIPLIYYKPLLEAENQTFNYYCHVISTLLTDGELLSEGNLDSKRNPFKGFPIQIPRETLIRSNYYWSKIGDITSWIQLINKFIIYIEDISQQEDQNQAKHDLIMWCRQQNINMPKMILILAYNEYILQVTQQYQSEYSIISRCCSLDSLKLNRTLSLKKQQSMPEHSEDIQVCLLRLFYKGLCIFSGHKSAGYTNYVTNNTYKLCYNNLMSLIGDFPLTCIVMAFQQNTNGQLEIKYSTKIDDIMIPQVAPKEFVKEYKLQFIQRHSLQLNEINFNGIGQVLFNELWKNQTGPQLSQECIIQPNIITNSITVLYDQKISNKEIIEQELQAKITQLQSFFKNQVREISYENDSKFIMQSGGSMKDWIEKNAYKTFFVEGFPLDINQELIMEYLGDVYISEMRLYKEGNKINARISLNDHDDLMHCIEVLQEYKGIPLKVYRQQDQFEYCEQKLQFNEYYLIKIEWNIHLNKGVGILILNTPYQDLEYKQLTSLQYELNDIDIYANENQIIDKIKKTHQNIDIKQIILTKRFRYESNGDIQLEIAKLFNPISQNKYVIESIIKRNCKRYLTLKVLDINDVESFIQLNDQIKTFRGLKIKLNLKPHYYHTYEGPIEMRQVVEEIFEEQKLEGKYNIEQEEKLYVTVECTSKENHIQVNKEIGQAFESKIIKNDENLDISLLFSQSGSRFLKYLEESLQIVIKQDFINNQILVNSSQKKFEQFNKQMISFLKDCSKSTIQIPKNCIRMIMGNDSQGLQEIKQNFELKSVKFNSISGELHLQGDQKNLDTAIISISEMLQSQTNDKPISQLQCNYCFDNMKNGYMLQGCGHKFCLQCIMFSVQNSLGDMTQLPIRCPQCNLAILLADMYILLEEQSWEKLNKLSINKYLQDHAAELAFCLTPNCPVIHFQKIPRYTCYKCKKQYCNSCRTAYHYGQTCKEFKAGNEDSINIYMKKNDVRRCPHCKILIQRIDGCYRVTCTGCKKSICWKNKPDGTPCMALFETSTECYAHLTKEHGGYW